MTSLTDLAWSSTGSATSTATARSPTSAAKYYEEALAIQRRLADREPDSVVRMRALASTVEQARNGACPHQRLRRGADAARGGARRSAASCSSAPSDTDNDALRDLSLALDRVGNVLRDMSDYRGALKYFEEELAIDRVSWRARRTT